MLDLIFAFCRLNAGWIGLLSIAGTVTALMIASIADKNRRAWHDDATCRWGD